MNYRRIDPEVVRRKQKECLTLLNFAVEIYEMQLPAKRHFLHEHLATASSWQIRAWLHMVSRRQWHTYASTTSEHIGATASCELALKPRRFLSSAPELRNLLGR